MNPRSKAEFKDAGSPRAPRRAGSLGATVLLLAPLVVACGGGGGGGDAEDTSGAGDTSTSGSTVNSNNSSSGGDASTTSTDVGSGGSQTGSTGDAGSAATTSNADAGSGGSGTEASASTDASGGAASTDVGSVTTTGGSTNVDVNCTLVWNSGFENGFPGEWLNYDEGEWSPDGTMPEGRVAAWTIIDADQGPVFEGDNAYKGWIEGPDTENHRAYPNVHYDVQTPAVNTFYVYLDVDYDVLGEEWIHFGTWGNFENDAGTYNLHTMAVRVRKLEFAHTDPFLGETIGDGEVPDFPLRQWVRFTVYMNYEGDGGFVQVWQDGVPTLRASVVKLAEFPGTRHTYAHWGMYAGPTASQAIQYNDSISVWELDQPLADLEAEPGCYAQ